MHDAIFEGMAEEYSIEEVDDEFMIMWGDTEVARFKSHDQAYLGVAELAFAKFEDKMSAMVNAARESMNDNG